MKAFPLLLIPFLLLSLSSCSGGPKRVDSKGIKSAGERVEELGKYFRLRTEVIDTEFDIFDANLNSGPFELPAPSSRLYRIALLVEQEQIDSWLTDVILDSYPHNYEWNSELIKDNANFSLLKGPRLTFIGQNRLLVLYENEGIIFIEIKGD